jgi:hypothetical protein
MGLIYAGAQITIAAAAGTDPSYGLVGIRKDRTMDSAREPVVTFRALHLWPLEAQGHIVGCQPDSLNHIIRSRICRNIPLLR